MNDINILLSSGKLNFNVNRVEILDKAKRSRIVVFFMMISSGLYGISSIISYEKTGDEFMLYSGIVILVLIGLGLIMVLFRKRSYEKTITYQEINRVKVKRNDLYQLKVEILLKNKRKRRISLKDEKSNLESFVNILNHHHIEIESRTI